MQETKIINFRKTRDFGEKLNATIEFIRQNFKGIAKSILFIAGPVILIGSVFYGKYMTDIFSLSGQAGTAVGISEDTAMGMGIDALLMILFMSIGYTLLITIVNEYITLYIEKQSQEIEVSEVWERVKKDFLMVLISGIGIMLIIMIGMLLFVIPGIYMSVALSIIFIIQITERIGFFAAVSRSLELIKEKWWSTLGLIMVAGIIQSVISYIFAIPMYIIIFGDMMHNIKEGGEAIFQEPTPAKKMMTIASTALYMIGAYVMYMISIVAIAFQYFNLVERKESVGLLRKIDDFGKKEAPESDDEGETY